MQFDIRSVPFSRCGSYTAFSYLPATELLPEGLYMRTVHGKVPHRELFRVELTKDGSVLPFTFTAEPAVLHLESNAGYVDICLPHSEAVWAKGQGVGARLTLVGGGADYAIPAGQDRWQVNVASDLISFMLVPIAGNLAVDAPWEHPGSRHVVADFMPTDDGALEFALEEFASGWREDKCRPLGFEDYVDMVESSYSAWREQTLEVPQGLSDTAELASYVNWASVVVSTGKLRRHAMLMSKNRMTNVWSWDHCFNAMALIRTNPDMAWDQFMIPFDFQHLSGALPDTVNDRAVDYSFTKPPIHGWTLKWMMERSHAVGCDKLAEVYEPLSRWTDFWFQYRDDDRDGIAQYDHGFDSGWDNSTPFAEGGPVESPDLSSYLILQMETLSEVASRLGRETESSGWKIRAGDLLQRMLDHFWRGGRFVPLRPHSHEVIESDSLLLYLPIILGERLPEDVRRWLVCGLKDEGHFLTEYGLSTESLRSPRYMSDGYWLGPIWAPATMIIAEGLRALGEEGFAREIAARFCRLVAKSGMAENFDALSGEGLRDRAYTWTSSIFLMMANEYLL